MISFRSHAWLPRVSTSAPAANSAVAMSGARPKPCEAFSAFTTARSMRNASRSLGSDAATPPDHVAHEQDAHRLFLAEDHAALGRHGVEPRVVGAGRHFVQFLRGV